MLKSDKIFRKTISYLLLPVMILFTFNSVFAYAATPITHHPATNIQWYISNGKDVVGTTDGSCASKPETYEYTPYGQAVDYSGQQQLKINNEKLRFADNPFQYSGYYQDFESGMYYLNARYYSPELMRFINRDTYDLSNRYAYGNGNPISNVDPNGHFSLRWKDFLPHGANGWIRAVVVFGAFAFLGAGITAYLLRPVVPLVDAPVIGALEAAGADAPGSEAAVGASTSGTGADSGAARQAEATGFSHPYDERARALSRESEDNLMKLRRAPTRQAANATERERAAAEAWKAGAPERARLEQARGLAAANQAYQEQVDRNVEELRRYVTNFKNIQRGKSEDFLTQEWSRKSPEQKKHWLANIRRRMIQDFDNGDV